ncbi:hypothetical protein OH460_09000 [Vibrio sp. Makdt]|uniref:hypothetical protein n=1 Tax=Vibrio sp. Makdt TaxID=2998828 RepID=UPI0022CDA740|nr:hypothetical protein [Vibrio sp. Makdt]MDA0152439.1 hypothetical protein [Vibrio sp. Makdt]
MLVTTIFNILEQAKLDECNVKLKYVNEVPTVVIQFGKGGATHKDSEAIQKLRKTLATPLFSQYEVIDNIDSLVIEQLGHAVESLSDNVKSLSEAESKAKKPKSAKKQKGATTASAASSVSAEKGSEIESEPEPNEISQPELESTSSLAENPFGFDATAFRV